MLVARAVALALLALTAAVAPLDVTAGDRRAAVGACVAALAVHALLGALPRRAPRLLLAAVDLSLVVDAGLILVLAMLAGDDRDHALWLLPLMALAATLALGAATGAKAAFLAALVVASAQLLDGGDVSSLGEDGALFVFIAATVVVAAALSAVNERELRRRGGRVRALHEATLGFGEVDDEASLRATAESAARALMPGWQAEVATDGLDVPATLPPRPRREDGRVVLDVPVAARAPGDPRGTAPRVLAIIRLTRPAARGRRVPVRRSQADALVTLATALAGALTRLELVRRLERLSRSDGLTGLANRRAFDEALAAELARLGRTGGALGLALIDVDHFKRFNDTHGHQAGDAALVAVAGALRASSRAGDHPCRFGGEEFALLLPGADGEAARVAAERVRVAVARAAARGGPVTVSVGVAIADATTVPEELIAAADERLYAAKAGGRNRVVAEDVATV